MCLENVFTRYVAMVTTIRPTVVWSVTMVSDYQSGVDHHGNGVILHPTTGILQSWERNTAGWNKRIKRLKVLPSLILENRLLKMNRRLKFQLALAQRWGNLSMGPSQSFWDGFQSNRYIGWETWKVGDIIQNFEWTFCKRAVCCCCYIYHLKNL